MSLLAIGVSTVVNFGISSVVPYPSTSFDELVGLTDMMVIVPFTEWYVRALGIKISWFTGLVFGIVLLSVQFLMGIIMGIVDTLAHVPTPEYSAHPIIMFILITVFTLTIASGTTWYLSIKHPNLYATS